jgi:hypothetical protein
MSDDRRKSYSELMKLREEVVKQLADTTQSQDANRAAESRLALITAQQWEAFQQECSDPASGVNEFRKATSPEDIIAIAERLGVPLDFSGKKFEIWAVETPAAVRKTWWRKIADRIALRLRSR